MVEHIVLFRWSETATPEAIENAVTALRDMKGRIDVIHDLVCGENFSNRAKGYTHGIAVRFADRAALETYDKHPQHQHVVATFLRPIMADILAMDFEF